VDLLPAYVAYVDRELRYVAANRMYIDRFGRAEPQIVGQLVADVTGPAFASVGRHLRLALEGEVQYLEPQMISVDGYRTLAVTHLPHRDDGGTVQGVIVYGYDITEQRRAEAALIQSEKLAAVGRLASSIAHEINNPLEAVMNVIYLIRQMPEMPEEARQYLEVADRELRRVSAITKQTLRFHKQSTKQTRCTADELFSEAISIYQGRVVNAGIEVLERYRSEIAVECFEGEIRQVLSNLVANAIDAMPMGGRLLLRSTDAMEARTGRRGVRLTVADTGCGMPEAVQRRLFEAFYSIKGIGGRGWVCG